MNFKKPTLLLTLAALILTPLSAASAHGEITKSIPAADSTVVAVPSEISIEFDGKLQSLGKEAINLITVTDNMGQIISSPSSVVDGSKISTRLLLTDVTGLVSVHYRIVSEDGHPVEGDYSFTVGKALANSESADATKLPTTSTQSQGLSFAGIVVIILLALSLIAVIRREIKKR